MIHEEALRLSRLTEELLDLAILESGKPEQWRMKKIDLREIIHKVVMKLKPQADAKNIHLTFETREKIIVKANSDRMEQVIINLLSNAIQFTPQGGRVTLKAREEEKQVIVEVIDTGEGIPAVELPYIWDRFYKVDKARTRKKTGGTGLGLSIVKSIIEAFGGRVFVESEIGKGSVFGFAIPKGV
jgi:signal transduction histidine kinase